MKFYLGTHMPSWLRMSDVPLFVSRRRLEGRKSFPRALSSWALDSGGFTELTMHGEWKTSPRRYADLVRMFQHEIGGMDWAAPQDWMCEPHMLKRTGLTVGKHQNLTTSNFLELRSIAPDLPIIPVLQGWEPDDYAWHIDAYYRAGVDLRLEPIVGVGTVCRRQGTDEAVRVFDAIERHTRGLRLHGFGFKTMGLTRLQHRMTSSDSLAWSYNARRNPPMPGHKHKSCANCLLYAQRWRDALLATLDGASTTLQQQHLL